MTTTRRRKKRKRSTRRRNFSRKRYTRRGGYRRSSLQMGKRRGFMRRNRRCRHFMVGGNYYGSPAINVKKSGFAAGFVAGRSSCAPTSHMTGYTHPV